MAEPFSGLEFFIMYNQTLDNTELSISNNFFSSTIINFYSEVNDGYILQDLSSIPVWWSVFSSDGTDTYGYNNAVGNIFDHLFAIIHEFELDFYQLPSDTTNSSDKNLRYVNQD